MQNTATQNSTSSTTTSHVSKRLFATQEQKAILTFVYSVNNRPSKRLQLWLADRVKMSNRRIRVWFQNKRTRDKGKGNDKPRCYLTDDEIIRFIVSRKYLKKDVELLVLQQQNNDNLCYQQMRNSPYFPSLEAIKNDRVLGTSPMSKRARNNINTTSTPPHHQQIQPQQDKYNQFNILSRVSTNKPSTTGRTDNFSTRTPNYEISNSMLTSNNLPGMESNTVKNISNFILATKRLQSHNISQISLSPVVNDNCLYMLDKIIIALENKNLALARSIVESSVKEMSDSDQFMIIAAVKKNSAALVHFLIQLNADLNAQERSTENSALHIATMGGKYDICKILVEAGAKIELRNSELKTSLHLATIFGHYDICKLFLDNGASIFCRDSSFHTPLHQAVLHSQFEIGELLIQTNAEVNSWDKNGATPLHLAARTINLPITHLLLKSGANCKTLTADTGFTPIHEIAKQTSNPTKQKQLFMWLADSLGDNEAVDLKTFSGDSLLHIAVKDCHISFISFLLDFGFDSNSLNFSWQTPMDIAMSQNRVEVFKLLKSKQRPDESKKQQQQQQPNFVYNTNPLSDFEFDYTNLSTSIPLKL